MQAERAHGISRQVGILVASFLTHAPGGETERIAYRCGVGYPDLVADTTLLGRGQKERGARE